MKPTFSLKGSAFFLFLSLFAALCFAPSALSVTYFVDLGSKQVTALPPEDFDRYGINDLGQVTGTTFAIRRHMAYITGPNGQGMTLLRDGSTAFGINNAGQVVGNFTTSTGRIHAFITGPNGQGMTDLGTLGGDLGTSTGGSINDAGQVVGSSTTSTGGRGRAFITGPNGQGMTDLGTLQGNSAASDINNVGQVVGVYGDQLGGSVGVRAFITGPNGQGMTDLGTLGGNYAQAYGINDAGRVTGISRTSTGQFHAFITGPNGQGMTDLGTLGGDYSSTYGGAINDAGQVAGQSSFRTGPGPAHAFITGPNGQGMTDLHPLLNSLLGRIQDSQVLAINNNQQIVVNVTPVPEPESYIMILIGLALVGAMVHGSRPKPQVGAFGK